MKKLSTKLLIVLLLSLTLIFAVACDPPVQTGEKAITIILVESADESTTIETDTDVEYLGQLIDELVAAEKLTLDSDTGSYGRFIKSIGNLTPNATQWIGIYSDEDDPTLVSSEFTTEFNEITYASTQFGMDDMPIYDGRTYLFIISG